MAPGASPNREPEQGAGFPHRVLILDGDDGRRGEMQVRLQSGGCSALASSDPDAVARELEGGGYDALFCDADLVHRLPAIPPEQIVVVTGGPDDVERALIAARFEARRRATAAGAGAGAASPPPEPSRAPELLGVSVGMRDVFVTIEKAAVHKATVLITGESGTGKELVARALHEKSPRAGGPFVAVNCGAIPDTLLESELFGHVKGSFTGAVKDKLGLFAQASGGTLFLDEIGELPAQLQVKLLRVLQEDEVRPVGATRTTPVDVRVVAATLRDLEADVESGRFRRDLYFRINVLSVHLPPLRERPEDALLLADHFLDLYGERHGKARPELSADARDLLASHPWPGNVRELENAIERAVVLSDGGEIGADLLGEKLDRPVDPVGHILDGSDLSIKKTTRAIERQLIQRALETTGGNRTSAARLLEISHRALLYKIKEYGL